MMHYMHYTAAMRSQITIATRGSKLALWQANRVRDLCRQAQPGLEVELLVVKTKGDKILDVPLAKVGGKGLFVKEIEQALLDQRADLAVHSMKDVPAALEDGLVMAAISERADPADALVGAESLEALAAGARVGTSSLRRACQLLAVRPDLAIGPLRGNVPTRIAKLDAGDYDAIILAAAGLVRLGFADRIGARLEYAVCLPAAGQGALGIEIRDGDGELAELVGRAVHHRIDAARVEAERGFLGRLGGGCQTPLAAHAEITGDRLTIDGLIGRPDGSEILRDRAAGPMSDAAALGAGLAETLLGRGGQRILAELEQSVQD
jgi:hydroxymethylbilane synthase